MDYFNKKLVKKEGKGEDVIQHSRYIKDLVGEMMHLDNLLKEYATKIKCDIKGRERFFLSCEKKNKELKKRAIKAKDDIRKTGEKEVRKEERKYGELVNPTTHI